MPENIVTAIRDWSPFIAFVVGGIFAFFLGTERQRWRVDQIGVQVEKQGNRIATLEKQGAVEAVTLGEIAKTQEHILRELSNLRKDLHGKVDK